ncbi:DUF1800 family protein [Roseibacillus persicicus]|nr:DUF1800 family protein [Roseibacillus persicicus]
MKISQSMPPRPKVMSCAIAALAIQTISATPVTVFDASFTSSEGFSNGVATNTAAGTAKMQSQGNATISNAAGSGLYNLSGGNEGGNYARSVFGLDDSDTFDEALVSGLSIGSTITFTATGVTIPAVEKPDGNNNVLVFGLANLHTGNPTGSSGSSGAGARIFVDAGGNIKAATATSFNPPNNTHVDTTIDLGEKFNLTVVLTSNGDGSFAVEQFYNGISRYQDAAVFPDFDKLGTDASGIFQAQGDNAPNSEPPITVEAISLVYETALPPTPPHGITTAPADQDLDGNGLPDVWEALYRAKGVDPQADSDGDGLSNLQEASFGTDPFDPYSNFTLDITRKGENEVTLSWSSLPSRTGILQNSTDLGDTQIWAPHGGTASLSDGRWQLDIPSPDPAQFFRVESTALDSDNDGVQDWLEPLLGFSTTSDASVYQGQSYDTTGDGTRDTVLSGDLAAFNEIYRSPEPGKSLTKAQAARLLLQTTFGPGNMAQVNLVANIGAEAWLDQQIATPPSYTQPYIDAIKADLLAEPKYQWTSDSLSGYWINGGGGSNPYVGGPNFPTAWLRSTLQGQDQLRQRVAWALSQILVTSRYGANLGNQPRAIANYYDMMIEGAFGNFNDLLLQVSLHPLMGNYLSHLGNQVADPAIGRYPDENYAREIMQLFSIGLWELNPDGTRKLDENGEPIPTYDNEDITNVAEVFTGVSYASNNFGGGWRDDGDNENQWMTTPMKIFASHHDWTEKKIPAGVDANGNRIYQTIPANPNGNDSAALAEVETVVDTLVSHPNCAPFICRQLIQFLVTSNPSPDYVQRIASVFVDNGSGETGDLEAVVKAIYLDDEARNPLNHLSTPHFGHFREPTIRTVHLARILKLDRHDEILWWDWGYYDDQSLQEPMAAPSVFNYYRPDFRLFGSLAENELDSPALGIVNSYSSISFTNYLWKICEEGIEQPNNAHSFWDNKTFPPDWTELTALASDVPSILDHLSILFCGGTLGAQSRETISTILQSEPDLTDRARLAVFLVLISPEGTCLK